LYIPSISRLIVAILAEIVLCRGNIVILETQ